jgi:hypothetical protein
MTLEFATKEAKRRTDELGTDHYVIQIGTAFIVTTYIPLHHVARLRIILESKGK